MPGESDILKIVREDILRILSERRKRVSLDSIKVEIKVSSFFISTALKELEKEKLICIERNFITLTRIGQEKSKDILEKHLVLENYFKKTSNEKVAHRKAHICEHYISKETVKNIKKLSTFQGRGIPLTELKLDKESLIADIEIPDNELFERTVSMGIFLGEKIKIINEVPNGIVIEVKNKKFVLDKDIAKEIKVLKYEKS